MIREERRANKEREDEDEDEDGKAIYLRFKSVFAGLSYSNNKTAKNG